MNDCGGRQWFFFFSPLLRFYLLPLPFVPFANNALPICNGFVEVLLVLAVANRGAKGGRWTTVSSFYYPLFSSVFFFFWFLPFFLPLSVFFLRLFQLSLLSFFFRSTPSLVLPPFALLVSPVFIGKNRGEIWTGRSLCSRPTTARGGTSPSFLQHVGGHESA